MGIDAGRTIGLMMNRRTGVLMGDLGDDFKSFMIQVRHARHGCGVVWCGVVWWLVQILVLFAE